MIREYVTFMNAADKWDEAYEMLIKYKACSKCLIIKMSMYGYIISPESSDRTLSDADIFKQK